MTEWIGRTLGDIAEEVDGTIRTGPFGSQLHQSDYVDEGIPVVMPKNIIDFQVDTSDIAYITEEDADRLAQHRLCEGDIVYGRRGDIGRQALVKYREIGWLCGTGCLRISLGDSVVLPQFLHYYLRNPEIIDWIYNQAVGATMPNLNTTILGNVPINYPPLETQRRIAQVLSAYDDLIENNTRRIKLLEQAAHDLYREWFVEFRFPGHADVEMVDSELGQIPQGWGVIKLPKVAEINAESIRKGDPIELIQYINISGVSTGQIDELEEMQFEDAPSRARRKVHHGDTIWSTVRPNRRSYALVINPKSNWIASTGFAVLTPKALPYTYFYQAVTADRFAEYLANVATGSAYPAVNTNDFKVSSILCPPQGLTMKYHEIVEDMVLEAEILRNKNNVLRETRDLLLPRLVSGQLDVSDVELPEDEYAD